MTDMMTELTLYTAQWRQLYFRPNKPLPRDAIKGVQKPRTPFYRAVLDFIIGCLCLGIPYIFLSRSLHQSFDEESGLYNNGPVLMVSACACLVVCLSLARFVLVPDTYDRLLGCCHPQRIRHILVTTTTGRHPAISRLPRDSVLRIEYGVRCHCAVQVQGGTRPDSRIPWRRRPHGSIGMSLCTAFSRPLQLLIPIPRGEVSSSHYHWYSSLGQSLLS